jgi:CheY-like chemotaxis protein
MRVRVSESGRGVTAASTIRRVLVADDDEGIREVMRDLMRESGYEVLVMSDGAAILPSLREWHGQQVVFLDWMMPGMNGHQVLRAVADDPTMRAGNLFILMTAGGKTLPLDLAHLVTELEVAYLAKPFEIDIPINMAAAAFHRLEHGGSGAWWSYRDSRRG